MATTSELPGFPADLSTRGRLLDAAENLLSQAEAPRLTLDAVAAAAGVSRTTAYRTFGSNDEMAGTVAVRRFERHRDTLLEVSRRERDVVSKIEVMVSYTLVEIANDPGLRRLVDQEAVISSVPMREMAVDIAVPLLEQGQAAGEIRQDVPAAELTEWLLETVGTMSHLQLDEHAVLRRFRRFIRPALVHTTPGVATLAVIEKTRGQLHEALGLLEQLRGTANDGKSPSAEANPL